MGLKIRDLKLAKKLVNGTLTGGGEGEHWSRHQGRLCPPLSFCIILKKAIHMPKPQLLEHLQIVYDYNQWSSVKGTSDKEAWNRT